jgi:hypothetical protein
MGVCASCLGRRKRASADAAGEREPLLPGPSGPALTAAPDPLAPPRTRLERAADALAALRAHKLPSHAQLEQILRAVLAAHALDPHVAGERGALSRSGRRVLADVRELLDAVRAWDADKNCEIMSVWLSWFLTMRRRQHYPGPYPSDPPGRRLAHRGGHRRVRARPRRPRFGPILPSLASV